MKQVICVVLCLFSGWARAQQGFFPIDNPNTEQQQQIFRDSIAQAIRNNIARQQQEHHNGQSLVSTLTSTTAAPEDNQLTDEELLEQAKSAHYSFGTSVKDSINDHAITRQEERHGLELTGMYSYSDGYYRRTVHYVAGPDGYRVVKEQIEPLGAGPKFNPDGQADVASSLTGDYTITVDDYRLPEHQRARVEAHRAP